MVGRAVSSLLTRSICRRCLNTLPRTSYVCINKESDVNMRSKFQKSILLSTALLNLNKTGISRTRLRQEYKKTASKAQFIFFLAFGIIFVCWQQTFFDSFSKTTFIDILDANRFTTLIAFERGLSTQRLMWRYRRLGVKLRRLIGYTKIYKFLLSQ